MNRGLTRSGSYTCNKTFLLRDFKAQVITHFVAVQTVLLVYIFCSTSRFLLELLSLHNLVLIQSVDAYGSY